MVIYNETAEMDVSFLNKLKEGLELDSALVMQIVAKGKCKTSGCAEVNVIRQKFDYESDSLEQK